MSSRKKFEKEGRVHGKVATDADRPQRCETTNGSEIGRARRNQTKHCGNANCQIEGPASPEDITAKAPEHSTEQEANVLGKRKKRRMALVEFQRHGLQNQRGYAKWISTVS